MVYLIILCFQLLLKNKIIVGFIAQELKLLQEQTGITIPSLVSDSNPDRLEASYGTLIPVLVQAIKELNDKLNKRVN